MKKYRITKENFLDYYFNTGSDQEQEGIKKDLGGDIAEQLLESGEFTITAQDLFDSCEHSGISFSFIEGYDSTDDDELGDIEGDWELELI